jgi:hypothetical protein
MPDIDGRPAQGWTPRSGHNGVVVGAANLHGERMTKWFPTLFDLRTGRYTILTYSYGTDGNTMGWLLVTANPSYVVAPTGRAVLPPLASGDRTGDRPAFLSEDGRGVGGQSNDANGRLQAVRWRCA